MAKAPSLAVFKREMNEKNEQFFTVILDNIANGVFTTDEDRKITSFNNAAEDITGFTQQQAIGQWCFDIFRANICQGACALRETVQTGKQIVNRPVNILSKDGRHIPSSISTAVLKDEEGNIVGGVETFRDLSAIHEIKKELTKQYTFEDIISKNHRIQEIFVILPDIAESDSAVLIQGPSGAGKELFANAVHHFSRRKDGPFVPVNCSALPDTLFESELFGHKKGAFTDAKTDKPGRFARAEGGTLFLDEIGDMTPALQVKLLRVLDEGEYEPLGAIKPEKPDVRIIAATNKDLKKLVEEDLFRGDLYYRLNVVKIELPSLAERREDIPILIEHFINRFNKKQGKNIISVSNEVFSLLMEHDFPGNVRELENLIDYAFVLCEGNSILQKHLPKYLLQERKPIRKQIPRPLESAEAEVILATLEKHGGNKTETAKELGINRSTLWRKMKKIRLNGALT